MKIDEVIVEAPMGILQRAGQKIMSKVPGSMGAKAQGKLDTGRVANEWKKQYMNYLGRTNQQPSTESLTAFLKKLGLDDQIIGGSVSEYVVFERPLTRAEVDKFILSAAQKAADSGLGAAASASAGKTAGASSAAPGAGSAGTSAADAGANTAAAGSAAPAAKPGLLKRAAGAVSQAVKGAVSRAAGAATSGAGSRVEPTVSAPSGAASAPSSAAGAKAAPAKAAGSDIDTYINNWAKSINSAATPQEKINLAKEVINFLKDRKGSPEGQRGATMAKSVLKRSGDPTLQKMAQSGAFAMERKMYAIANKLLEAVGLSWKDLGYRVLVTESTAKHVMIGIR